MLYFCIMYFYRANRTMGSWILSNM